MRMDPFFFSHFLVVCFFGTCEVDGMGMGYQGGKKKKGFISFHFIFIYLHSS